MSPKFLGLAKVMPTGDMLLNVLDSYRHAVTVYESAGKIIITQAPHVCEFCGCIATEDYNKHGVCYPCRKEITGWREGE